MRFVSAVTASAILVAGIAAADEPHVWLTRMNEALTTRNYDGVFLHVHGGRMETLRVIHRVDGQRVTERLISLDGSAREFIRRDNELTCYLPDKRTVLVEKRKSDGPLLGALPKLDQTTTSMYEITGGAQRARLMGRDARLVSVTPRDGYRYGYRLWIDEATAMPLKTQLCDEHGDVIEQIVFSNLSMPARIPDSAFEPQVDTRGFRWLRNDQQLATATAPVLWEAMRLPPGFRLTTRGQQAMPGSKQSVSHLVFTDGIASVSVFVEARADTVPPLEGSTQLGSSSAFSTIVDGHQVTAVGEVPATTVRFIATQVKPRSPASERAAERSSAPPMPGAARSALAPTPNQ
ncbi:MAG: MucB/RseB C-terminal domain-containing protein [Pseudomonadales bacterium]|nr:MucB/RseB C-terminal domain-containing protein [Pseudomonadales bacterium]